MFIDVTSILLRLVDEFKFHLSQATSVENKETKTEVGGNLEKKTEELQDVEIEKHRSLIQSLLDTLEELVKVGKTPVIILDGVDKVKRATKLDKVIGNKMY